MYSNSDRGRRGRSLSGIQRFSATGGELIHSVNGKKFSCRRQRPLYGMNLLFGGSAIGGSTVHDYWVFIRSLPEVVGVASLATTHV